VFIIYIAVIYRFKPTKRTHADLQNNTHKTKERATWSPPKYASHVAPISLFPLSYFFWHIHPNDIEIWSFLFNYWSKNKICQPCYCTLHNIVLQVAVECRDYHTCIQRTTLGSHSEVLKANWVKLQSFMSFPFYFYRFRWSCWCKILHEQQLFFPFHKIIYEYIWNNRHSQFITINICFNDIRWYYIFDDLSKRFYMLYVNQTQLA
jgi:hypothetical protein